MELESLFGSRVRAGTLATLAVTSKPQSAYRVAKAVGAQPIHVLNILKNLVPAVESTRDGWILRSDQLRLFLLNELRERDRARREEKDELLAQLGLRPSSEHGRSAVRRRD